jgi:zinc finger RNA-binding protein
MQPSRTSRLRDTKIQQQQLKEAHWRQMDEMACRIEEADYQRTWWGQPPPVPSPMFHGFQHQHSPVLPPRRSLDDKYVNMKHTHIIPKEGVLDLLTSMVGACEQALMAVSDIIAAEDGQLKPADKPETPNVEPDAATNPEITEGKEDQAQKQQSEGTTASEVSTNKVTAEDEDRALKGTMRVGLFAKNLLIDGDNSAQLVLLCRDIPTVALFDRIVMHLCAELPKAAGNEKYGIEISPSEAAIYVSREEESYPLVTITLTSPTVRSVDPATAKEDVADALDRQKCLQALAEVRRTKWFRIRCQGFRWARVINRVLRDFSRRVPCWSALSEWMVPECMIHVRRSLLMPLVT